MGCAGVTLVHVDKNGASILSAMTTFVGLVGREVVRAFAWDRRRIL